MGAELRGSSAVTSFFKPKGKDARWFAPVKDATIYFAENEPRVWKSIRKAKDGRKANGDLFAFPTMPPNAEVGEIQL